ncbi:MAG: dihydrofolate reductase [Alphaproteobacteria bacterium]|nr:dihydrofolate reductase [Alphaproteobacteria bacterium]
MAIVALIVAMDDTGVIGREGALPWRIREDMAWFKETTMGKPCIMGRKTWESLPKRPLPGRVNIVVTRTPGFVAEGAVVVHSMAAALEVADGAEIMVIGGAEIYRAALPFAGRIYLTRVHGRFDGDVHFPAFDQAVWEETALGVYPSSPERPIGYSFIILNRRVLPHERS